jgi:hypothetical protein
MRIYSLQGSRKHQKDLSRALGLQKLHQLSAPAERGRCIRTVGAQVDWAVSHGASLVVGNPTTISTLNSGMKAISRTSWEDCIHRQGRRHSDLGC